MVNRYFNIILVLWVLAVLAAAAFWVTVGSIAWHFISKYW